MSKMRTAMAAKPKKPAKAKKSTGAPRFFALSLVKLDAAAVGEDESTRAWVQVALENTYLGYKRGQRPFQFTREVFEQCVANIHSHPSYSEDGSVDIIPWDFEHFGADFIDEQTVRQMGMPAQAWSSDLKLVEGEDADGKPRCGLWALTRFLDPARTYIVEGKYKGASVELEFDYVDPVSGEHRGARVRSVALTNQPFVQGMEELSVAASYLGYYSQADSTEAAFNSIKQLLGLSALDDIPSLMVELGKLDQWAATGTAPLGVAVDEILGCMRQILGLPALSTAQEVLDNARQIVTRLLEESGAAAQAGSSTGAPAAVAGSNRRANMEILKVLAALLGVRESEDAVRSAVAELVELRDGVAKQLKLSARDSGATMLTILLKASEGGADARTKLSALLKALGVEDVEGAVERVASLISSAAELKEVMPELEGLRTSSKEAGKKMEEADVEEAMTSYSIPEAARDAVVLLRETSKERFLAKFPKKAKPAAAAVAKGVTASQVAVLKSKVAAAGATVKPAEGGGSDNVINLSIFDGRNPTEQAMSYLRANMAGWDKMSREEQFKAAVEFKKQKHVVFTGLAS